MANTFNSNRLLAKGRKPAGMMNDTETLYSKVLDLRRSAGEIDSWHYEAVTLRLAKNCRYETDFFVHMANGEIEIHEVKAFWTDDAKVKIKVAARLFPMFRFIAVRKVSKIRGTWEITEFEPCA